MSNFFLELFWMLSTPDSQPNDWYAWVTTLSAHILMIGGGIAAILLLLRWSMWIGVIGYALWEALQLWMFNGQVWDSIVDWAAISMGIALIWAAWNRRRWNVAYVVLLIAIVSIIGVWERQ